MVASNQHRARLVKSILVFATFLVGLHLSQAVGQPADELAFSIERTVAHSGFDKRQCWVHARVGVIPPRVKGNEHDRPLAVMTSQKLLLTGSDVFYRLHHSFNHDKQTWTPLQPIDSFARQTFAGESSSLPTGAEIAPELLRDGDETTVCDFVPQWHAASQRMLGIGHTVWYRNNRVMHVRPRGIAYSVFDAPRNRWSAWNTVKLPDEPRFRCAGSGSQQRVDLPGGDILLPIYCKAAEEKQYQTVVARCRFDGHQLHYVEHGNSLTINVKRGLYEPSLTFFQGRYFLTMRNDDRGYVSTSEDGLNFEPPRPWTFDDGTELGNYNTQQHWVTHDDGLFLVYTRRGAENDHVFRHRAPLFIARVDPQDLQVIRSTERVLVPERGARLGNFGVVNVSPKETWVTVAEWMQPKGVEKHGSDNSIFVAKLKWNRPNSISERPPESLSVPSYCQAPVELRDDFGHYRSPLVFDDGRKVQSAEDWHRRREQIRSHWINRLGTWPPLITDPNVDVLESKRRDGITQHRIRFRWTPSEFTHAYLLVPDGDRPMPAVVTVYYEPETAIGLGKPERDFAIQLARRGFVTLSIGTSEATAAKTYALYHPSIENAQVQPLSMLAYAAANAWHVLANRSEVDADRIGIVGHSFGGKWAMFASCLFDKFACAAWSDPGIVFDSRPSVNYWEPWYLGYHPKPWRNRGVITDENPARGLYPRLVAEGRDLHELHALMAPRPFLVSGGSEDPILRWRALNHTVSVNNVLGVENRVAMTNRPDHSPNPDSNEIIYRFFAEHLNKR